MAAVENTEVVASVGWYENAIADLVESIQNIESAWEAGDLAGTVSDAISKAHEVAGALDDYHAQRTPSGES